MSIGRIVLIFVGVWALAVGVIALSLLRLWETGLTWVLVGAFVAYQAALSAAAPLVEKHKVNAHERRRRMAVFVALAILTMALLSAPRLLVRAIG